MHSNKPSTLVHHKTDLDTTLWSMFLLCSQLLPLPIGRQACAST
jgi:hypothetical protein